MIANDQMVDAFRQIAVELCETAIQSEYGDAGLASFRDITSFLPYIHKNINRLGKQKIYVISSVDASEVIPSLGSKFETLTSPVNLATNSYSSILIEVTKSKTLHITDQLPSDATLNAGAVVYKWENGIETIVGSTFQKALPVIPGIESYFSITTFKSLDEALEFYKINYALSASCDKLQTSFENQNNRLYFVPGPEEILRDSLHKFLKTRLRENVAVEREQNMDASHPVDIKITWNYTSHIAIIEVKWLGSSYDHTTGKFVDYSTARAKSGAKQLAEYLEMINTSVTDKVTRGYLVVYDIRRKKAKPYKTTFTRPDGFHFENLDIEYNPEYHLSRSDFSKPIRFFIKPYLLS